MNAPEPFLPSPPAASSQSEDAALFGGLVSRDPGAWSRLIDRFGPLVKTVALRAGARGPDLDDVLQATWATLLKHAPAIEKPASLSSWIATTASREAWRQKQRRQQLEGAGEARARALGRPDLESPEPEFDLIELERAQVLRDGLAELGERCRALLEALFLAREAPAYADLARQLGLPIGSLGPTRARCLAKLEALLRERGLGGELP
jgi:RNA polymerase sigma factor (sigma-70 family)